MNLAQIRAIAALVGFPDPDLAAAVAMAESTGDPYALNVTARERSYGLWQINVMAHPQFSGADLFDPETNARAALEVSAKGTDWSPWTMYTNGHYRQWMPGGPWA